MVIVKSIFTLRRIKKEQPMLFGHISDLHIDQKHKPENIRQTEQALRYLRNQNIDHLIVSGDISHDARPEDLCLFRDMLKHHGFWHASRTSITIGNHDIFGGVHLATDLLHFPQRCMNLNYEKTVADFAAIFADLFHGCILPTKSNPFPYAKPIGDYLIIGINSIAPFSLRVNPMSSNGKIDTVQYDWLKKVFGNKSLAGKEKIINIHHHFADDTLKDRGNPVWRRVERQTMKLHRKSRLLKLFLQNDVKAVFHGHTHLNYHQNLHGIDFINAGATVEDDRAGATPKINLVSWANGQFQFATEVLNSEIIDYILLNNPIVQHAFAN
jgi:3',5'-cyclic AMP phosphodiesterase CpdA